MTTNQKQVGALLKALIGKGVETKDAIPTMKHLIEAKIFSLEDLTESNIPNGVDTTVRQQLLAKRKRRGGTSSPSKRKKAPISIPPVTEMPDSILINRNPVLILWATVVAQHLYSYLSFEEALSIGNAVSSHTAKAKGTKLGIYTAKDPSTATTATLTSADSTSEMKVLGVTVLTEQTPDGIRARTDPTKKTLVNPSSTWTLLQKKFEKSLAFILDRMQEAATNAGAELESTAYRYYMHIRPEIPHGTKGWGAYGRLETSQLSNFYAPGGTPGDVKPLDGNGSCGPK